MYRIPEKLNVIKDNYDVEYLGEKDIYVYDIGVDVNHNFFANDILVHNSLFIGLGEFLDDNIGTKWRRMPENKIISYMIRLSNIIQDQVNNKIYREIQRKNYNSNVTDFRISLKQEIVAKTALFIRKKKYAYWVVNSEGAPVDTISATGLEIVRSDTPEAIRPMLKEIMSMILKKYADTEIIQKIEKYKRQLYNSSPEELAVNMGVSNIEKYINETGTAKGTPWHVKGVYNYRQLLKLLKIDDIYDDITSGMKAKVLYLKKNPLGADSITFIKWPKEFDNIVQIDYNLMVNKFFINKIEFLLEPMNKANLLDKRVEDSIDYFF